MSEYFDILDENGNKTGKTKLRSEVHRDGDWHREVYVFAINDQNQVLIQLRSPEKISHPNMWDVAAAGHATSGDNSMKAIIREIKEEIGLDIKQEELKLIHNFKRESFHKDKNIHNRAISDVYLLRKNIALDEIKIQKEEVAAVKYIDLEKLESEIKTGNSIYINRVFYPQVFSLLQKESK